MNIVSKERYEAAGNAWVAARARMDAAVAESHAAESALFQAEADLARQEAAPGVPAYWHDQQVTKDRCRIGPHCKVHADEREQW